TPQAGDGSLRHVARRFFLLYAPDRAPVLVLMATIERQRRDAERARNAAHSLCAPCPQGKNARVSLSLSIACRERRNRSDCTDDPGQVPVLGIFIEGTACPAGNQRVSLSLSIACRERRNRSDCTDDPRQVPVLRIFIEGTACTTGNQGEGRSCAV